MNRETKKRMIAANILEAILSGLKEKSFDEMSSEEIAQRAQVSKRTLYQYFTSKNEMYLGLVWYSYKALHACIVNTPGTNQKEEKIERVIQQYLMFFLENPVEARLINQYDPTVYLSDYEDWVATIREYADLTILSQTIEDSCPKDSVELVQMKSLFLISHLQGFVKLMLTEDPMIKAENSIEEAIKNQIQLYMIILKSPLEF